MDRNTVAHQESDFASQRNPAVQNHFQVIGKDRPSFRIGNILAKRPIVQQLPLDSQQLRSGKIYLTYQSMGIKGKIANRCKVIEFGVLVSRHLKRLTGLSQFFILHLQLDMMYLQFVNEPPHIVVRPGGQFLCGFRLYLYLSTSTQCNCFG
jgi:hypothetical protein